MAITTRKATPVDDAGALCDLGRNTFYAKWHTQTTPGNMKIYLEENYNIPKINKELLDPAIIYIVAEDGEKMVGFARLLFTTPDVEKKEPGIKLSFSKPLEISRIYVSTALIGQAIGVKIMDKIFEIAKEERCDLIWLGVWGENPAVSFYKRHGFVKAGTHRFVFGEQIDWDWVMMKKI